MALALHYYHWNQYDSLQTYVRQGMQWLQASPSDLYAGDLHYLLAMYYRLRGQYQASVQPLQRAIAFAQRGHYVKGVAKFQYALAVTYFDLGDLARAVDQITTNLAYLSRYTDTPMQSANYMLLIALYRELDNKPMKALYQQRYAALDKHD